MANSQLSSWHFLQHHTADPLPSIFWGNVSFSPLKRLSSKNTSAALFSSGHQTKEWVLGATPLLSSLTSWTITCMFQTFFDSWLFLSVPTMVNLDLVLTELLSSHTSPRKSEFLWSLLTFKYSQPVCKINKRSLWASNQCFLEWEVVLIAPLKQTNRKANTFVHYQSHNENECDILRTVC